MACRFVAWLARGHGLERNHMLILYGSRHESVAKARAIMLCSAFDMQIFLSSGDVIFPWSCLRVPEAGRRGQVVLHFRPACLTGLLEYNVFCISHACSMCCADQQSDPHSACRQGCVQKLQCRCIADLVRVQCSILYLTP